MLEDIIYFDFFMNGEHFTVEDYTEDAIAFTDRTSSNNNGALNDTVVLPYSV